MLYGAFSQMNAHVNPYGDPWIQWHHTHHVRLCPVREHLVTRNIISKIRPHKNVNVALCYTVHFHKWMRTWTPAVSHESNDTTLTMWGCALFESTSSQEIHNFENSSHKNVNFALCYTVHFQKRMRTWTPAVPHDSNDTTLTMWGCAYFENTSSQETHNIENSPPQKC